MIAPLFQKNSLEQTQFELREVGFVYKGRSYTFDDVIETRSYRVTHQTHHVPAGFTSEHDPAIGVVLVLKDGERIQITEQSTLLSSSKQERVDRLQHAFDKVCAKTFKQRTQKYVNQVSAHGYFEYSGWRFTPAQRKLTEVATGRAHSVEQLSFMRRYGFIELVPTGEGLAAKLLRKSKTEWSGRLFGIETLTDTDVFFALLKHYFQLAWQ
jgi:hypothetical protein